MSISTLLCLAGLIMSLGGLWWWFDGTPPGTEQWWPDLNIPAWKRTDDWWAKYWLATEKQALGSMPFLIVLFLFVLGLAHSVSP